MPQVLGWGNIASRRPLQRMLTHEDTPFCYVGLSGARLTGLTPCQGWVTMQPRLFLLTSISAPAEMDFLSTGIPCNYRWVKRLCPRTR